MTKFFKRENRKEEDKQTLSGHDSKAKKRHELRRNIKDDYLGYLDSEQEQNQSGINADEGYESEGAQPEFS